MSITLYRDCQRCEGTGEESVGVPGGSVECGGCGGTGKVKVAEANEIETILNAIVATQADHGDTISDILDKCEDIKEKVDEIKEVVDEL